ncbi:MAG: ECF transporter S component [Defluviitaleaceae bacterium]|nr:ECF transporter S component [Defluviitaleaceae bacterium]
MDSFFAAVSVIIIMTLAAAFVVFEKRRATAEKLVLIAILSAISAAGRFIFTPIPNVQPSSFIIIIAGIAIGAETGFMVGALTALLSSFLMGFGPWTPFQMAAWGMMGGAAGLLRLPLSKNKPLRVVFGAAWGFLFGWIMNVWMILSLGLAASGFAQVAGVYAASFIFDSMHSAVNALLIFAGGDRFFKTLKRIAEKYGLSSFDKRKAGEYIN